MTDRPHPPALRRVRGAGASLALAAALTTVGAALAAAATHPTTLGIARGVSVAGHTSNVVTNSRGVTVYTLSGENAHHLKCTKASGCLMFWPPVTVRSARTRLSAATGIHGRLGLLHRDGFFQVTLGGRPLYTYFGDHGRRRSTNGQGIVSFGGTWRVITVASRTPASMTTTSTTSTMTAAPYPY